MSRGLIDEQSLADIQAGLESVEDVRLAALTLSPDFLGANFDPEVHIPVAAVCFHDCTELLAQTRYALFECLAHGRYYRTVVEPANPMTATFFERYYLDDAALRLYAAGEHLANAVILMLDLSDVQLAPYRKNNRVSQQAILAEYLKNECAGQNLTDQLTAFGSSADWRFTMNYRNRWVHEQPPTVAGMGIQYRRKLPWTVSKDKTKKFLAFGMGDEPEFQIGDLLPRILAAYRGFVGLVGGTLNEYFRILSEHGIERENGTITITLRL